MVNFREFQRKVKKVIKEHKTTEKIDHLVVKKKAKLLIQFGVSGKSDKIGIWLKIHCWIKEFFVKGRVRSSLLGRTVVLWQ